MMAPFALIAALLLAGAALAGILASLVSWPAWLLLAAAAGLAALAWPRPWLLGLAAALVGAFLHTPRRSVPPREVRFSCRIAQAASLGPDHTSVLCSVLRTRGRLPDSQPGNGRIRILGSAHLPLAPGRFLWGRAFQRKPGLLVARAEAVLVMKGEQPTAIEQIRWNLRRRWEAALAGLPEPGGTVLRGLLLGSRGSSRPGVRRAFARTGIAHILVVSGLHLGLLAFLVFWLCRRIMARARFLLQVASPNRLAALASLLVVWSYVLTISPGPASLRAAIMASCFLLAAALARSVDPFSSLGAAVIACLAVQPQWLVAPGFQLSVAATAALLWLGRQEHLRRKPWPIRAVAASAVAGTATWGLAAHHFGSFSVLGILSNLVAVPLFCWLVLPLGLLGLGLALLSPWAASPLLGLAAHLAGLGAMGAEHLAEAAWWTNIPWHPNLAETAGYYLALGAGPLAWETRRLPRRVRSLSWVAAWTAAGLVVALSVRSGLQQSTFYLLGSSCGQASALVLPGRRAVMVDAGCGSTPRMLARILERRWIRCIHLLAVSHCHRDHAEGALWLLEHSCIRRLWLNDQAGCPLQERIRSLAREKGIPVEHGHRLSVGAVEIRALTGMPDSGSPLLVPNDRSLVLRLDGPGWSLLLPGDAGPGEQRLLLEASVPLRADILVAPHHGSDLGLQPDFLRTVRAKLVLVAGRTSRTTWRPWRTTGARLASTHQDGDLKVDLRRGTFRVAPIP